MSNIEYPHATSISDKTKMKVLEALIPLLEECKEIMGRWNGDEAGLEEDLAYKASEIAEIAVDLQTKITEMEEL